MTKGLLSVEQVLEWADDHHRRHGEWPRRDSGPIPDAVGVTWKSINEALQRGHRGLPGGSSLPALLAEHRGHRNRKALPTVTVDQVPAWADSHHRRTGQWPKRTSGTVIDAPGEEWIRLDHALRAGNRGLPAGSSPARLPARHRRVRHPLQQQRLTDDLILSWAKLHRE